MGAAYRNCRYIAKSLPIVKQGNASYDVYKYRSESQTGKKVAASHITTRHISFWDSGYRGTIITKVFLSHKNWMCNVKFAR